MAGRSLAGRDTQGQAVEQAVEAELKSFIPGIRGVRVDAPTQEMPGWLQAVADWNPFSAVAAACRHLFGNPNPSALVQVWPMQHPELAVLLWSALLLVIFAPLGVHLYRRKSLA